MADYYLVLGVERGASADEIKKAYRRRALELHPDKNTDRDTTEDFKLLAEAFAVLSDPAKRSNYDTYGHEDGAQAASQHAPHRHVDFSFADQLFRSFFGGRDPFADMFGGAFPSPFGHMGSLFGSGFPFGPGTSMLGGDMFAGFGGLGSGQGFSSFTSMSSSSSLGSGVSRSTSSSTTIENGRRVTRTTTTTRYADGREETHTDEKVEDVPQGGYLTNSAPSGRRAVSITDGSPGMHRTHSYGASGFSPMGAPMQQTQYGGGMQRTQYGGGMQQTQYGGGMQQTQYGGGQTGTYPVQGGYAYGGHGATMHRQQPQQFQQTYHQSHHATAPPHAERDGGYSSSMRSSALPSHGYAGSSTNAYASTGSHSPTGWAGYTGRR